MKLRLLKQEVVKVFDLLATAWPDAHCELLANTPFQFLLAVLLSARTTDKSVNKALKPLFEENPEFGPNDLVRMGSTNFLQVIRQIGLAPTKAIHALLLAEKLLKEFDGKVPNTHATLMSLPGVGRKTANVILNLVHGMPTLAVDTHVTRVSLRLGLVPETCTSPEKIEAELLKVIPQSHLQRAHHYLIFHGRYQCIARSPKCSNCAVESLCLKRGVNR